MSKRLDEIKVKELLDRVARDVDEGLLPGCTVALGFEGEIVVDAAFGDATTETRYTVFSATKAIVASVAWMLIGDGTLDVTLPVAAVLPEFGANGKQDVTIEQVMLHTSGFPYAPMPGASVRTHESRREQMATWTLEWEPGTAYEYHAVSAHWVLGEIITELTGREWNDLVEERVTAPLGLGRVLGEPVVTQRPVAVPYAVGEPPTPEEVQAVLGIPELPPGIPADDLITLARPEVRELGVPGAGGVMRASDLATFYQALLHDPQGMWEPFVLDDVRSNVRNRFPDRVSGLPARRTLGLVTAGEDGQQALRGFGHTNSPRAFGHNGARGQIAWADPETGLSLGYCTNGLDENVIREGRRTIGIGSRAAVCVTD